jgi:hypothetical protein
VAVGGERFLAPASDGVWHRLVVDFAASNRGKGDYTVFLDGALIDARSAVSLIAPEGATGTVELGLFREGQRLEGASGLRVAGAGIGESSPSSLP